MGGGKKDMKYEIINPHDKAYLEADDHEIAVIAIILVGKGLYGLKQVDGDFTCPVLAFISGWVKEAFGKTAQEIYDSYDSADRSALKKVLQSFHLKGVRSSLTDFVRYAHELAALLEESA